MSGQDKQHPEVVVGSGDHPHSWRKPYYLVGGGIIVLLIIALVIVSLLAMSSKSPTTHQNTQPVTVCSTPLITQASQDLAVNDITATAGIDQQVTAMKGYKQDPNCVYIALRYAIMTGNDSASKQYYNQLLTLKQQNGGKFDFSSAFGGQMMSLPSLLAAIKANEANQSAQEQMSTGANGDLQKVDQMYKAAPPSGSNNNQ